MIESGAYYIYAQVFFETYPEGPFLHNCVVLNVNGGSFALLQTGLHNRGDYDSVYTGGVIDLKAGDMIGLATVYDIVSCGCPTSTPFLELTKSIFANYVHIRFALSNGVIICR